MMSNCVRFSVSPYPNFFGKIYVKEDLIFGGRIPDAPSTEVGLQQNVCVSTPPALIAFLASHFQTCSSGPGMNEKKSLYSWFATMCNGFHVG